MVGELCDSVTHTVLQVNAVQVDGAYHLICLSYNKNQSLGQIKNIFSFETILS
jgi:hypothetical protein